MNITVKCSDVSIRNSYRSLEVDLTDVDSDIFDTVEALDSVDIDKVLERYKVDEVIGRYTISEILNCFTTDELVEHIGESTIIAEARKIKIDELL